MTAKDHIRNEAICELLSDPIHIEPGQTVYTILRHVARSGMSKSISLLSANIDPNTLAPYICDITSLSARALCLPLNTRHGGIFCPGYGQNMGAWLVYQLSTVLFPYGFGCRGRDCPSCEHSNGDRSYTRHIGTAQHLDGTPNHWHKDGTYALRQAWL
jgi:hypothetical protein